MAGNPQQRFTRQQRLRYGGEFARVYARRCCMSDAGLRLCACENDAGGVRLGLSVSRKVGNAVARNRWKRLLREAFRSVAPHLPQGIDLVAIPQRGTPPELATLCTSLTRLAGLLETRLKGM